MKTKTFIKSRVFTTFKRKTKQQYIINIIIGGIQNEWLYSEFS